MKRVLLVASTTGYQVREFGAAAEKLGFELVLATDRCHILPDPWADNAAALRFNDLEPWLDALASRGPFDGILAVGDQPSYVAAQVAGRFGLRYHPAEASRAAGNKLLSRMRFREAGLPAPEFRQMVLSDASDADVRYPCVLKPLEASASRGVIRADNRREFFVAVERIAAMLHGSGNLVLVEDYIPGREFALEGLVTEGRLTVLAIFDKPDPLEGPFFEETIYITPSRELWPVQSAIRETAQKAITALGLTNGPIHAEMRVNKAGVWMLEVAARPIGGLCARALSFGQAGHSFAAIPPIKLEEVLLRHAVGAYASDLQLAAGAHGVMMIPIPRAGVYRGVDGMQEAAQTPHVEEIVITAKEGQMLVPLPEGSSYLGFIFARAGSATLVENCLRTAHQKLQFNLTAALPVVK
jgi:formate-dependent phosphoribosylglycinamide formyltransferase (GAR transformylase)